MSGSAEGFVGQEDIEVYDVNMDGTGRGRLTWDRDAGRYRRRRGAAGDDKTSEGLKVVENEFMQHRVGGSTGMGGKVANLLRNIRMSFLPRGVSEDYYAFTVWRIAQRIVSSTVSVFGTQSLLLALGVKTHKVGAAAASGWVIANAIGKFAKMSFAAGWGRDFDSDAKRWRFRAALMWIIANGMEIVVYVVHNNFPRSFVFLVALSVSLKQISILTSSATRGTFYKQFAGQNENLGDITAKGDAQVAIADLLGMVVGIQLARLAGSTAIYIWGAWMILSAADFICILKSLDTIIFKFLNLERASLIAHSFVNGGKVPTPAELALVEPILSRPRRAVPQGNLLTGWYWDVVRGYWAGTFRKISETTVTPIELKMLLRVFANGQYMVLHSRHPKMSEAPPRPCLVLRQSATEDDVLEVHAPHHLPTFFLLLTSPAKALSPHCALPPPLLPFSCVDFPFVFTSCDFVGLASPFRKCCESMTPSSSSAGNACARASKGVDRGPPGREEACTRHGAG